MNFALSAWGWSNIAAADHQCAALVPRIATPSNSVLQLVPGENTSGPVRRPIDRCGSGTHDGLPAAHQQVQARAEREARCFLQACLELQLPVTKVLQPV